MPAVRVLSAGISPLASFKRQFDINSYKKFFEEAGYKNVGYYIIDGKMPCAVAVITKEKDTKEEF